MAEEAATPIQTQFCGHLRSKKFFKLDRLAANATDYIDAANHVWCSQTQEVFGPDNFSVHPDSCGPERSCYRSAIE